MKKRNITFAILILAVVLTACGVSGTYARYITTDKGTGTATVAQWEVVIDGFEDDEDDLTGFKTITLSTVANEYVQSGFIAPDSDMAGDITVSLDGSQVAADIYASIENVYLNGTALTEAQKEHFTAKILYNDAEIEAGAPVFVPLNKVATPVELQVLLHWNHSDDETGWNAFDTDLGELIDDEDNPVIKADIKLTVQQHVKSDDVVTPPSS